MGINLGISIYKLNFLQMFSSGPISRNLWLLINSLYNHWSLQCIKPSYWYNLQFFVFRVTDSICCELTDEPLFFYSIHVTYRDVVCGEPLWSLEFWHCGRCHLDFCRAKIDHIWTRSRSCGGVTYCELNFNSYSYSYYSWTVTKILSWKYLRQEMGKTNLELYFNTTAQFDSFSFISLVCWAGQTENDLWIIR